MREFKLRTSQRPRPIPPGRWAMSQRWNDLLFAHWRVQAAQLAPLVPEGVQIDTFDGSAWLGVVPFWMDRIKFRSFPLIPGANAFPELNVRTYVRDHRTGTPGVYFFSLDAKNLAAVLVARMVYHLPYYWAEMKIEQRGEREFFYTSKRRLAGRPVNFKATYRGLGPTKKLAESNPGTLEYFLTERYCLFTQNGAGQLVRANVHHIPWPLENAEAQIEENDLARAIGVELPNEEPVLHYARRLAVYVWPAEVIASPAARRQRVPAQVLPSA